MDMADFRYNMPGQPFKETCHLSRATVEFYMHQETGCKDPYEKYNRRICDELINFGAFVLSKGVKTESIFIDRFAPATSAWIINNREPEMSRKEVRHTYYNVHELQCLFEKDIAVFFLHGYNHWSLFVVKGLQSMFRKLAVGDDDQRPLLFAHFDSSRGMGHWELRDGLKMWCEEALKSVARDANLDVGSCEHLEHLFRQRAKFHSVPVPQQTLLEVTCGWRTLCSLQYVFENLGQLQDCINIGIRECSWAHTAQQVVDVMRKMIKRDVSSGDQSDDHRSDLTTRNCCTVCRTYLDNSNADLCPLGNEPICKACLNLYRNYRVPVYVSSEKRNPHKTIRKVNGYTKKVVYGFRRKKNRRHLSQPYLRTPCQSGTILASYHVDEVEDCAGDDQQDIREIQEVESSDQVPEATNTSNKCKENERAFKQEQSRLKTCNIHDELLDAVSSCCTSHQNVLKTGWLLLNRYKNGIEESAKQSWTASRNDAFSSPVCHTLRGYTKAGNDETKAILAAVRRIPQQVVDISRLWEETRGHLVRRIAHVEESNRRLRKLLHVKDSDNDVECEGEEELLSSTKVWHDFATDLSHLKERHEVIVGVLEKSSGGRGLQRNPLKRVPGGNSELR